MKVAIFGGTGFVGSYIVDALVAVNAEPILLARSGSRPRNIQPDECRVVEGDINDDDAVAATLAAADAAIYNIGILREQPHKGITFDALQAQGATRVIRLAKQADVRRFVLMSANGVDAASTPYQQTKLQAERYLQQSGLDWTIFRPSVVFGDPRGRMEFATQLKEDIIDSPLPAPLFFPGTKISQAGLFELSPVHVADVAAAFATALTETTTVNRTLHLGGPKNLSWRTILETIATACGRKKVMLPVPALGVSTAAALLDRFEQFPVTRDQIKMLLQGNTCSPADLIGLGIEPTEFSPENLGYLQDDGRTG
jgi:NADH dehydrogenase